MSKFLRGLTPFARWYAYFTAAWGVGLAILGHPDSALVHGIVAGVLYEVAPWGSQVADVYDEAP